MARRDETRSTESIFSILHFFKKGTLLSYEQIARLLGESITDAKRDIEAFSTYEIDNEILHFIVLTEEEFPSGGIAILDDLPVLDKPLRLSASESDALLAALDHAGLEDDDPLRALLMETRGAYEVEGMGEDSAQSILEDLAFYCEKRHQTWIHYCKPTETEPRRRLVEPQQLYLSERGDWYLDAFCPAQDAMRTFKVARISAVEDAVAHFQPQEPAEPAGPEDADAKLTAYLDDLPRALLRMPADEPLDEREWPGMELVDGVGSVDGWKDVTLPYDGLMWIARHVVARLGRVQVLEPPEVAEAVCRLAQASLDELEHARAELAG